MPLQRGLGWCQGESQKQRTTPGQQGVKRWSTERNVSPLYWLWSSVFSWSAGSHFSSPTLYRQCAQRPAPSLTPSLSFSSGSVTATPHLTQSYTPSSTKILERLSKRYCAEALRVLSFSIQIQCIGHGRRCLQFLRHRKKKNYNLHFSEHSKGCFKKHVELWNSSIKFRTESHSFNSHGVRKLTTWTVKFQIAADIHINLYRVWGENRTWNRGRERLQTINCLASQHC